MGIYTLYFDITIGLHFEILTGFQVIWLGLFCLLSRKSNGLLVTQSDTIYSWYIHGSHSIDVAALIIKVPIKQIFFREEKRKYKELKREVDKMAAMMKEVGSDDEDEDEEEEEEDSKKSETEEEETETETEQDTESETESESEPEVSFQFI